MLLLIHFNRVPWGLRKAQRALGLPLEDFCDVIYADHVSSVVMADSPEELTLRAAHTMRIMHQVTKEIGLEIMDRKTQNLLLNSALQPQG